MSGSVNSTLCHTCHFVPFIGALQYVALLISLPQLQPFFPLFNGLTLKILSHVDGLSSHKQPLWSYSKPNCFSLAWQEWWTLLCVLINNHLIKTPRTALQSQAESQEGVLPVSWLESPIFPLSLPFSSLKSCRLLRAQQLSNREVRARPLH